MLHDELIMVSGRFSTCAGPEAQLSSFRVIGSLASVSESCQENDRMD